MHVATLDYDDYLGFVAVGRITDGKIKMGDRVLCAHRDGKKEEFRVQKVLASQGLKRFEIAEGAAGDIVAVTGMAGAQRRRDHHRHLESAHPAAHDHRRADHLDAVHRQRWTVRRAGRQVRHHAQHPRAALQGAQVQRRACASRTPTLPNVFKVSGRGELHLSVLIETMRREGYELCVSQPEVIFKIIDGKRMEPYEEVMVDVDEQFAGRVIEKLGSRGGRMTEMAPAGTGRVRVEYLCPSRGLIGYRSEFLTDTRGTGILNHNFAHYGALRGPDEGRASRARSSRRSRARPTPTACSSCRSAGSSSSGSGQGLRRADRRHAHARQRSRSSTRRKAKQLTNIRTHAADEKLILTPPLSLTLEEALEFINDDELVEVTPKAIRLRKRVLDHNQRKASEKRTGTGAVRRRRSRKQLARPSDQIRSLSLVEIAGAAALAFALGGLVRPRIALDVGPRRCAPASTDRCPRGTRRRRARNHAPRSWSPRLRSRRARLLRSSCACRPCPVNAASDVPRVYNRRMRALGFCRARHRGGAVAVGSSGCHGSKSAGDAGMDGPDMAAPPYYGNCTAPPRPPSARRAAARRRVPRPHLLDAGRHHAGARRRRALLRLGAGRHTCSASTRPARPRKSQVADVTTAPEGQLVSAAKRACSASRSRPTGRPTTPSYLSFNAGVGHGGRRLQVVPRAHHHRRRRRELRRRAHEQPMLSLDQPFTNHNGGNIVFGPDGYLYFGLGDGGSGGDPRQRARTSTSLLGKMLRIDVDRGDDRTPSRRQPVRRRRRRRRPEIYAYGLRNPWRWSFDRATGELWVGDVGQNAWEEVDKVAARRQLRLEHVRGHHKHCYPNAADAATSPGAHRSRRRLLAPRSDGGNSITGGYVYRGSAIPSWSARYIYADDGIGRIWRARLRPRRRQARRRAARSTTGKTSSRSARTPTASSTWSSYGAATSTSSCPPAPPPATTFPQTLSATGCVDPTMPTQARRRPDRLRRQRAALVRRRRQAALARAARRRARSTSTTTATGTCRSAPCS